MVLPSLIPTYDAEGDVLYLLTIETQQVRDVSITWNINATYTPEGELAELQLLNAKADSQKILMQALEGVGRAGIAKADSALVITTAVMLRNFDAVPDFTVLPEAYRADAGYLVEYLVQTILVKRQADKVLMAIDRFKPECPNFQFDVLADSWGASGTMAQRPSRQPDLELVRGKAFIDRLHQQLQPTASTRDAQERWLREQVVPAAMGLDPDPSQGNTIQEFRQQLEKHHQDCVASRASLPETGSAHITPAQYKAESQGRMQRLSGTKSYLARVRAAAEQLAGMATAKTDDFKRALLASIDWQLVSEEFDSVVEKYAFSVERYASRLISNLHQLQLNSTDAAELQVTLADLEAHLEDFETIDQLDAQVAEAWHSTLNEQDVERGMARDIAPILTLADLQQACAEKLALDRQLSEASQAYRDTRTLPYDSVDALLRVCAMPADDIVSALVGGADRAWKKTSTVLVRTAHALDLTVSDAVLGELAFCLPQAVAAGLVETQGDLSKWMYSEIRLKGHA